MLAAFFCADVIRTELIRLQSDNASDLTHHIRSKLLLASNYSNLNHGSFGVVPEPIVTSKAALVEKAERSPDLWYRGQYQVLLRSNRCALGRYVKMDPDHLAIVENTSTGINSILNHHCNDAFDAIFVLSCAYEMVNNTAKHLARQHRAQVRVVDVDGIIPTVNSMPSHNEVYDNRNGIIMLPEEALLSCICQSIQHAQQDGLVPAILVISHIVSKPALILPVAAIVAAAKQAGVQHVCVDGAHAPGQIPLDLSALFEQGVDSYVGNCHKWLYAPKGTAFLAVRAADDMPAPVVVGSEDHNCGGMERFTYTGTRDYTSFCLIKDAIEFRAEIGEDWLISHSNTLARWCGPYLADVWQTYHIYNGGHMTNIRLPMSWNIAQGLTLWLLEKHHTSTAVFTSGEQAWIRVSVPAYVTRDEVKRLGQLVLQYAAEQDV
eukprot:TRINITY_DN9294_c0_g1_i1.p1 TRINITY_DN9294_c0_g1~~TRINITY_DN9294_c0_g1_i1.p1  ORF type:complete len:434 (+),score=52.96 TRINITY_DN9294_c0_g1_i1:61-1362(+)